MVSGLSFGFTRTTKIFAACSPAHIQPAMHHVRCHIDGIAALQHLRSFAIGLQRERAIEFIVELMRIRVDVPGHRGARGEGVVLDVHFPAGLSSKVRDLRRHHGAGLLA